MGKDLRWQIYVGFVADIDIEIPGPFLDNDKCARRGGGYLFLPGFLPCMVSSMDG
jgi:hypothetical protein